VKRAILFFLAVFLLAHCTPVYRVRVEVERPPAIDQKITKLYLKVEEKSLENDFVELRDVKSEVEKFLKNELETSGNIKILPGEGHPLLLVTYETSLKRAYTYYSPQEDAIAPPSLVAVKIIRMNMCFSIREYGYRKCLKERMKFMESESSLFALYAVLQRMTSALLSDIAYQKKEIMHYLLR